MQGGVRRQRTLAIRKGFPEERKEFCIQVLTLFLTQETTCAKGILQGEIWREWGLLDIPVMVVVFREASSSQGWMMAGNM